jgi:hypothetical protein
MGAREVVDSQSLLLRRHNGTVSCPHWGKDVREGQKGGCSFHLLILLTIRKFIYKKIPGFSPGIF